jgi:hypothetical protein
LESLQNILHQYKLHVFFFKLHQSLSKSRSGFFWYKIRGFRNSPVYFIFCTKLTVPINSIRNSWVIFKRFISGGFSSNSWHYFTKFLSLFFLSRLEIKNVGFTAVIMASQLWLSTQIYFCSQFEHSKWLKPFFRARNQFSSDGKIRE